MVIETPYEVMKREKLGINFFGVPMFLVCTGSSPKTTKAQHVNLYIHLFVRVQPRRFGSLGSNSGWPTLWYPMVDGFFWRLKNVDVCRPIDGLF